MTRKEFKALLKRLQPAFREDIDDMHLPLEVINIAAHCFVHGREMSPDQLFDMEELRQQYLNLETKGHFVFEGE